MYEVEFGVPTAQFAYVHLKITNETVPGLLNDMDSLSDAIAVKFGQTHAVLTGAVHHGHANPVIDAEIVESNPEELIKSELGGKVLETRQKAAEDQPGPTTQPAPAGPSEAPSRPWNKPVQPVTQKPWESELPVGTKVAVGDIEFTKVADIDDFFS